MSRTAVIVVTRASNCARARASTADPVETLDRATIAVALKCTVSLEEEVVEVEQETNHSGFHLHVSGSVEAHGVLIRIREGLPTKGRHVLGRLANELSHRLAMGIGQIKLAVTAETADANGIMRKL
jgi:hypothetical protein